MEAYAMRHPFDGIEGDRPAQTTRRSALARMLGAVAGLFGLGAVAKAAPPRRPTTLALGEEGGRPPTTLALGEEGGRPPTTLALGEEGSRPPVTTQALGEEGGKRPTT